MMQTMKKLNFGCGKRLAAGWTHIDFHSDDPRIQKVNLLQGFPFPEASFDVVYSSHVLEHFTQEQAQFLLREAQRVLKPQGILRLSVPDLESLCREYLRILDLPAETADKAKKYEWIAIELLDQLVRSQTFGKMGEFYTRLNQADDPNLRAYVAERIGEIPDTNPPPPTWSDRLAPFHPKNLGTTLTYGYLKLISYLIPPNLRNMVFVETQIGERHRWMYDTYSLTALLEDLGFQHCQGVRHNESAIPGFVEDGLDTNHDGTPYKTNSIYVEAYR